MSDNIYYDPKKFDATLIGSVEDTNLSYEFDIFIAMQDAKTARVYVAQDSGCSCPTPFEDITGFADMREIRTLDEYRSAVSEWNTYYDKKKAAQRDLDALEEQVRKALRRRAQIVGRK